MTTVHIIDCRFGVEGSPQDFSANLPTFAFKTLAKLLCVYAQIRHPAGVWDWVSCDCYGRPLGSKS